MAPPPSSAVRVTATITPDGYRRFLVHLAALRLRFVLPVLAFFTFSALATGFNAQALLMALAFVATLLTVWGYVTWNVSSPSNATLYLPVAYEFDQEGIVYAGESGTGRLEWSQVQRWRVRAQHYQLYVAGASYLLIPAKDVDSTDVPRLESLFADRIAKGPGRRT